MRIILSIVGLTMLTLIRPILISSINRSVGLEVVNARVLLRKLHPAGSQLAKGEFNSQRVNKIEAQT